MSRRSPDPPLGFTGASLDRAEHLRRDEAALAAARTHPAARFLVLADLKPVMTPDRSDLVWCRRHEAPDGPMLFLGLDTDGAPRFAIDGPAEGLAGRPVDARAAGAALADGRAAIVAQARSLIDWHRRHGHCSACGAPTRMARGGAMRCCEACGAQHFPRVDPVVIMLALHDGHALVGRQSAFPPGFFSALAGFVEPGESLEEAVRRELCEEAGVEADEVRYVASQPWPFPSSLMMGTVAEVRSAELRLDGDEIEEARWVDRAEVAAVLEGRGSWSAPPPLAIAHSLLKAFARGL